MHRQHTGPTPAPRPGAAPIVRFNVDPEGSSSRGVLLIVLVGLASIGASAQAPHVQPWSADDDYNDLWQQPSPPQSNNNPASRAFPRGMAPLDLLLSFHANTNHVLVEWKRPRFRRLTRYQLRMKKADARSWGRWQEVGPVEEIANSVIIHSVEPGVTYEVEVRARNHQVAGPPAAGTVTIPELSPPS